MSRTFFGKLPFYRWKSVSAIKPFSILLSNYLSYNSKHLLENVCDFGQIFFYLHYFKILEFFFILVHDRILKGLALSENDVTFNQDLSRTFKMKGNYKRH